MFNKLKKIIKIGTENDQSRVEWLRKTLKSIPSVLKILDAGAGEKRFKDFCSHLKYVSQDFAQYNGESNNVGLQMGKWDQTNLDIVSDITSIPEPDGSFDAVLCSEVFEHIPDPISAIKEFSRLTKKGGHLIITAPFYCGTHFEPYYFYSGFSRYFYETFLTKFRFEIKEIVHNGRFFNYIAQETRRMPTIAKMYTKKGIQFWEYPILFLNLIIANRLLKKDEGSREFMTYGLFVYAIKK